MVCSASVAWMTCTASVTDTLLHRADTLGRSAIKFSAFVDVYYAYDIGHSSDEKRARQNEPLDERLQFPSRRLPLN